uniref:EF-hand domain-containing protein n=1 Tax=Arion vulgaris TaxID=1028688 RepID=A0A0B7ABG0_9EUPU
MHQPNYAIIILALTGTACAVFYTKSADNDYPRIGRRSFYTSGNPNHYPRIGRRDASNSQLLLPGLEFTDLTSLDKRGVFTQSAHGSYPRVGRGSEESASSEEYVNESRKKLLERIAGIKEAIEDGTSSEGSSGQDDREHFKSSLNIMFKAFDVDSNGKLSKEEFTSGMNKYKPKTFC